MRCSASRRTAGEFALVAMRESVHKIFEISRLDQVFKIYPGEGAQPNRGLRRRQASKQQQAAPWPRRCR